MRLDRCWSVCLLAFSVLLSVQITAGSTLGAVVNIELLDRDGSPQVWAHYSLVSSVPCSGLEELCAELQCSDPLGSPVTGALPSPGWCLRQWQRPVPSEHTSAVRPGSDAVVSLYSRADVSVRADTNRVNRPPSVALPPPVRFQDSCPQEIPLSVLDLDGDEVRCRFEKNSLGEFLQLNEEACVLRYGGGADPGRFSALIAVEDFPLSANKQTRQSFSTVSLHLLITVEKGVSCSGVPEFSGVSPAGGAVLRLLPFEELQLNITVASTAQSVSEIAVIGPPGLFITPVKTGQSSQSSVTLSWVRGPNAFAHLLSVCFAANTQSLQSNISCIWIQQTQTDPLPAGTELKCKEKDLQMSLVLPISFLENLHLSGLQLNDPSCPVLQNASHVTTTFSLTACGTRRTHFGSDLLYTNTLRSISPSSTISRVASLVLPLACRIPAQRASGPALKISVPEEVKTFGAVSFWLEFHAPGQGPMSRETRVPREREAGGLRSAGRMETLDLHVFSNCSVARAELAVGRCVQSDTQDFKNTQPLLSGGCVSGNGSVEILTSASTVRVYRLNLGSLDIKGNTMFVECLVHLCITTKPTQRCPDPCADEPKSSVVDSILTRNYTVRSGPVSLLSKDSTTTVSPTQSVKPIAQPAASASRSLGDAALCGLLVSLTLLFSH